MLLATPWLEQDALVRVKSNKLTAGASSIDFYLNGRQLDQDANMYTARVKFTAAQQVYLNIVRRLSSNQTTISNSGFDLLISRETHVEDTWFWIRLQCTGTGPTTIRAKVWRDGTSEPGCWDTSITDNTAALQVAGTIGMRAFCGSTNETVVYTFDDLLGIPIGGVGTPRLTGGGSITIVTQPPPVNLSYAHSYAVLSDADHVCRHPGWWWQRLERWHAGLPQADAHRGSQRLCRQ